MFSVVTMANNPQYLGPAALAREFGVSHQSVNRAEARGKITRSENGKFDLERTLCDWVANTHPARLGITQPPKASTPSEHQPLINFWITLFNNKAGAMAILLKQDSNLSSKEVWEYLSTVFLIEWEVISQMFVNGNELPLELEGVAKLMGSVEGQKELEEWLEKR